MEDDYAFYRKYGYAFPNSGRLANEPLMRKWFDDRNKERKAREILHLKQFNKAYKVPNPPGQEWSTPAKESFDRYYSFFNRNGNHPLDPPV